MNNSFKENSQIKMTMSTSQQHQSHSQQSQQPLISQSQPQSQSQQSIESQIIINPIDQKLQAVHMGHDVVEIDYEALPENSSVVAQLGAGAFAGIMEHTVMYPVDAIKTRMQTSKGKNLPHGIIASVSKISSTEGASALWRGVTSVVLGAGPAHAIYYLVFESTKTALVNHFTTTRSNTLVTDEKHPLIASASGIAATITSDALMTPFDVIKQRMQLYHETLKNTAAKASVDSAAGATTTATSTTASAAAQQLKNNSVSVWSMSKNIYKNEGLSPFFISYPTTLILNIPFAAINFGVYEWASSKLNPNQSYNPLLHCISGGISGAAAAAVTTPFDCIKTTLQTKSLSSDPNMSKIRGFKDAAVSLYRNNGYPGFFRGLRPRVVFNVPSTAISWTAYEMAKAYISS